MDNSVQTFPIESPQYRPRFLSFGITSGAKQVETLTCPAVAGATQADFAVIYNTAGESIAVWLDIDADGTEPTSALYTGATYQAMASVVTGDTATLVAAAVFAAVDGVIPDVTFVDNANGTITVTQDIVEACSDMVRKNADGSGNGSFTVAVGTQGSAVAGGNGKFDATIAQSGTGTYVVTFDHPFSQVPEAAAICSTDNRVARISAIDKFSVTIETQDVSGGATANASFSMFVAGSDAIDSIRQL